MALADREKAALMSLMAEAFTWIRQIHGRGEVYRPGDYIDFHSGCPFKDLHTPEEVFVYVGRMGYAFHNVPAIVSGTYPHERNIYDLISMLDYIDGTGTEYGYWAKELAKRCGVKLPERSQFIVGRPDQYGGWRWTEELIEEVRKRRDEIVIIPRFEYDYLRRASQPRLSFLRRLWVRVLNPRLFREENRHL